MSLNSLLERLAYKFNEDDLQLLDNEIVAIFRSVSKSTTLQEANDYFNTLDKIQFIVAKLVFKEGVTVSDNLRRFVRDFDRLDDPAFRSSIFGEIKSGLYSYHTE